MGIYVNLTAYPTASFTLSSFFYASTLRLLPIISSIKPNILHNVQFPLDRTCYTKSVDTDSNQRLIRPSLMSVADELTVANRRAAVGILNCPHHNTRILVLPQVVCLHCVDTFTLVIVHNLLMHYLNFVRMDLMK